MTLLFSMLPVYVLGNLHCFGMCGPLVMMIGRHRYRSLYFFGRLLSFSLAGLLAGEIGAVLNLVLQRFHLPAAASFLFGGILILIGLGSLLSWRLPPLKPLGRISQSLSLLMLRDAPLPAFLFGFFTVALPCGQTLLVFSACALSGSAAVGLLNGFAFGLLTSPSLFFAMQTVSLFQKAKKYYTAVVGISALLVGALALCRGFAEMGWIPHQVLNQKYHLVLY